MTSTALLSLISPVIAVAVAAWGFRRATKADKLRAFFEIQSRYLATEVRAGRRVIHRKVAGRQPEEIAGLDQADLDSVGYALAVMNSVAIASEGGYVDYALIKNNMGRSFTAATNAARAYIDRVETIRGYRPYPAAERLANRLATSLGTSGSLSTPAPLGTAAVPPATAPRDPTSNPEPEEERGSTGA